MSGRLLSEILPTWQDDILNGKPRVPYAVGFPGFPLFPKQIVAIGAPPGAGKTCLTMGMTFDALETSPDLRAVVCNVEVPPDRLLDRELARVSGVPSDWITDRSFRKSPALTGKVVEGMREIAAVADRLIILGPSDLGTVLSTAVEQKAGLLVLDYIQRILPKGTTDLRTGMVDAMNVLREYAMRYEAAIIVISAVSRGSGREGAYKNLTLGSFRESSELEFGADDAYVLEHDEQTGEGWMVLRHLKPRYGRRKDIRLRFEDEYCRFVPGEGGAADA
jgi:replicative DNA helicase